MTKKRVMTGGGAVMCLGLALVFLIPASRRYTFGVLRGEASQRGRYLSQWVDDLESPDEPTRYMAAATIGTMMKDGRPAVLPLASAMTDDPSPHVRGNAALALHKIASGLKLEGEHATEAVPALTSALNDEAPQVRMNAAMALAAIGEDASHAVPGLIEAVGRPENREYVSNFTVTIREQMLATLGAVGPAAKDAVPLLLSALEDKAIGMRLMAARALGRIGPIAQRALPQLIVVALEDDSAAVKFNAREAVELIDPEAAKKLPAP